MLYINFKTYEQGTGERALRLAEMLYRVRLVSGITVVPVVQAVDLYRVSGIEWDWAWCQHADPVEYGANSGWALPEGIKKNGGNGVMLNHAERKINYNSKIKNQNSKNDLEEVNLLRKAVERCRAVGLSVGICADSLEEVEAVVGLRPDWIAYEPPELIGSKELSVSTPKPDVVA